jgi:hypothetical protein
MDWMMLGMDGLLQEVRLHALKNGSIWGLPSEAESRQTDYVLVCRADPFCHRPMQGFLLWQLVT